MANQITLKTADRAILVGASGTGKSTLAKYLLDEWRKDYPRSRVMVVDTKPRWRAERMPDGSSPKKLYAKMAKGDSIPGSMCLSSMADWELSWDHDTNPSQTVVVQRIQKGWKDQKATQRATVHFGLACMERYFAGASIKRESLLYIDEGHDFFTATGSALGSDIIQRAYRAGREIGLTELSGFQRPSGLNLQVLTETNYAALFRINFENDVKKMYAMGWPKGVAPPTYDDEYGFRLWREGRPAAPMFRLTRKGSNGNADNADARNVG